MKIIYVISCLWLIGLTLLMSGCKDNVGGPAPVGPAWIVYSSHNTPLNSNRINYISVDSDGKMWFATDTGAASFDAHASSWAIYNDSLKTSSGSSKVLCVTEGRDKSIWFGLLGGGVERYNRFSSTSLIWQRFTADNTGGALYTTVNAIAPDLTPYPAGNGEVWFGTPVGIAKFKPNPSDNNCISCWTSISSTDAQLTRITYAQQNPINAYIWFGGDIDGVSEVHFDINFEWAHYTFPFGASRVNGIAFDLSNNVWFAKDIGASVLNFTSGLWKNFTKDSTAGKLPSDVIYAVETNLRSTRWFGTDSGLVRLNDTTWTVFNKSNSPLPDNKVTAIRYDLRGNLWIGTVNGAAVFNPNGTTF